MSFSYNENRIAASGVYFIDFVRFTVDDTDENAYDVSDEVITALYNQTNDTYSQESRNYSTAVMVIDYLITKARKGIESWSSAGTSINYGNRVESLLALKQSILNKQLSVNGVSTIINVARSESFWE